MTSISANDPATLHRSAASPAGGAADPDGHAAFGTALGAYAPGGGAPAAESRPAPGGLLHMMQELMQTMQQLLQTMEGGHGGAHAQCAAPAQGTAPTQGAAPAGGAQSQAPGPAPGQAPAEGAPDDGGVPQALSSLEPGISAASKATGVPKDLLSAVIWDESRGKAGATSTNPGNGKTDGGLMQINPDTFSSLQAKHPELKGKPLSDPDTNILAGAALLADEKGKFGSWDLALRAYNSGEGSVNPGDANITTTGLGDADYVRKVNQNKAAIDSGSPLPA